MFSLIIIMDVNNILGYPLSFVHSADTGFSWDGWAAKIDDFAKAYKNILSPDGAYRTLDIEVRVQLFYLLLCCNAKRLLIPIPYKDFSSISCR